MQGTTVEKILRVSLSLAFIYPAVSAWFNPFSWIGYFPLFMVNFAGSNSLLMLHTFGATEITIGLWVLLGKRILYPSIAAALYLLAIVLLNISQMDIIFRDISILGIAVALIYTHLNEWNMNGDNRAE